MKERLLAHCVQLAAQKVQALEQELRSTREATTSESKSTAGDKHETGRAMMHLEQEKLHKQIAQAQSVVVEMEKIDGSIKQEKGAFGSLIRTNKGSFLIAGGLGKVVFEEADYYVVSAKAPIASKFLGKVVGEIIKMNGNSFEILSVE